MRLADPGKGLIIAAPHSGSGKTLVTLGLCRALAERGIAVAPAKTGPDYIDPTFLARAARTHCINLDPWAMTDAALHGLAAHHAGANLLVIEGVMGLFDGAASGGGATADLAATLQLRVILVVDCSHMAQSVAALVSGFVHFRDDVRIAGIILNKVASARHESMLRAALEKIDMPVLGALHRDKNLSIPDRHLGLTLPDEMDGAEKMIADAATVVSKSIDLDMLLSIAAPLPAAQDFAPLPPLGQHMAIAQDAAFSFIYTHHLRGWQDAGGELSFFSPLANEAPDENADAVFLPGGYPELHGATLANAAQFKQGLLAARNRGALIYGECGGFMVLGQSLSDKQGIVHEMAGLLPVDSRIDQPKRVLGYRQLSHASPLPWPARLSGHEFHYSSGTPADLPPLFTATDALGDVVAPMGAVDGRVMGSYAHVIAEAP